MTVYRNSAYATLIAVVSGLFTLASIAYALQRSGELSAGARWGPVAAVAVLAAFCLLRLARAGVYADDDGIRVVNPLRTVHIPWERIMRFTVRATGGFPAVGFAELTNGSRVQLWGIQSRSPTAVARRVPAELVEQLNARLELARAGRDG